MPKHSPFLSLESKFYQPKDADEQIYKLWEDEGVFKGDPTSKKPPFSMVIPPPNVTGRLHMGHALNNSAQDAMIRYKRMDGYDAMWLPGTDHAGISTQSVVKKQLDARGINYLELGREKTIAEIWEWKKKYGDRILHQLRRMGCSCDWSRTRFTMDDGLSLAVRTAFKNLYDAGLVYRGKYIVNWCPVDRTALSNDEVATTEGGEPGHLWHIKYPLADGTGHVTVATTRPETMLGDAAVAVNPADDRYKQLVGKMLRLPLTDREIPIITDDYVDREYGTGCLKVTPAHDPNDFQIGLRHNLPQINVMNEDATIGDGAPASYHGMDRFVCRERVVSELKALGLLVKIDDQMTPIVRAQRSRAIIEYRLSDQWFVKMQPLAQAALKAAEEQNLHMHPQRWEAIHREWLEKSRDWCISRQIWWGHRVPAWYNKEDGRILVDIETPAEVQKNPDAWREESDVLDTWFSSWLWPCSTLGWPENTTDMQRYYPTSALFTAKDIIYLWVARMAMAAVRFTGKIPFQQVYFHPVICDANGETMSKSRGNGIDPLHIIEGATLEELGQPVHEARPENLKEILTEIKKKHPAGFNAAGADALRITLLSLNSQAQQVQLSLDKFEETGQRFITKLWNATKFALSNLQDVPPATVEAAPEALEDRWILGQLDSCVASVRGSFDTFVFSDAVGTMQQFFWDDFCDWYVELSKPRLRGESLAEKKRVQLTLCQILSSLLRLYHPIIPFVTEELWQHFHASTSQSGLLAACAPELLDNWLCARAAFPKETGRTDKALRQDFALMQDIVRAIRNIRSSSGIDAGAAMAVQIRPASPAFAAAIERGQHLIVSQARLKSFALCSEKPARMAVTVLEQAEIFVNLAEHLDVDAELARNRNALQKAEGSIAALTARLANPEFTGRAPQHIQDAEKARLAAEEEKRSKLLASIAELQDLKN